MRRRTTSRPPSPRRPPAAPKRPALQALSRAPCSRQRQQREHSGQHRRSDAHPRAPRRQLPQLAGLHTRRVGHRDRHRQRVAARRDSRFPNVCSQRRVRQHRGDVDQPSVVGAFLAADLVGEHPAVHDPVGRARTAREMPDVLGVRRRHPAHQIGVDVIAAVGGQATRSASVSSEAIASCSGRSLAAAARTRRSRFARRRSAAPTSRAPPPPARPS